MAAKKRPTPKKPSVSISKLTQLDFQVDAKKLKQIQQCLKRGSLKITLSDVDLEKGGRFRGAYEYD